MKNLSLKSAFYFLICLIVCISSAAVVVAQQDRDFYQIKIYQLASPEQEVRVDHFLQTAYIPALHRAGIPKVGVFKPVGNDTSKTRRIFVLIPLKSLDQLGTLEKQLDEDNTFTSDGKDYIDAPYNNVPYLRIESILLKAFPQSPHFNIPDLKSPANERIYELRSYEGPTEKLYKNKVEMFNKGDEVGLFKKLGFNAVFYAEVISGAHMPNLMYMTSFENMASHDQHWKSFSDDPYWKKLSALPEYQHNVSSAVITLLHPTDYSEM